MIKKWDIALIAVLLALSFIPEGIFLLFGEDTHLDGTKAVIQVDGAMYKEIPLSTHKGTDTFVIETAAGYNTVVVRDGEIGIVEADCPDKICIHEGFISQPGQTAVCLPHKVLIEVRRQNGEDPDIIPAH